MNVLNGTNEPCPECSVLPGAAHTSECSIPKYGINVNITKLEVHADDPDRFVFGLHERIEREAKAANERMDAKERALDERGYGYARGDDGGFSGLGDFTPRTHGLDPTTDAMAERTARFGKLQAQITEISKQRDEATLRMRIVQERRDMFQGAIADQAVQIAELRADLARCRDDAARTRSELMAAVEHAERLVGERNEERERRKTHEARVAHLERLASDNPAKHEPTITAHLADDVLAKLEDQIDNAWGLIANASGGDWSKQDPAWVEAAKRWRNKYSTRTMHDPPMQAANADDADPAGDGSPLF